MKQTLACLIVAAALSAAACSDSSTDTSTSPTPTPTTPLVTENFSGTVQPGSNDSKPFTVTSSGFAIAADLTSAGPPATISMGIGVGTLVGGTCQLSSGGFTTTAAGATPQLNGTIASGTYCFMVYDVGNQSGPITYTAVVTHY